MFFSPWYFLLLLLLPVVAWRLWSRSRDIAVPFSSTQFALDRAQPDYDAAWADFPKAELPK